MTTSRADRVKAFGMTNMLLEADLDRIESEFDIDLGRKQTMKEEIEGVYYPQFDARLRREAESMARHYQVFYCLERMIRDLISDVLETVAEVDNWWDDENVVPIGVRTEVEKRIRKERSDAVTPRSTRQIDYTTFGELSEIIRENWAAFGGAVFNDKAAVLKVMSNLNTLRGPIAHCSPLAEDEALRLELSVRDWFRIML